MLLDGSLKLLDVLSPTFSEGSLRLSIPLLALLGGSINLDLVVSASSTGKALVAKRADVGRLFKLWS